jgi:hypothetical protein
VAEACFEKHARDLEAVLSVLSAKQKRQMYASLKKVGQLAAQTLDRGAAGEKLSRDRRTRDF